MGVIKRFFGVPDDSPSRSQQESVTDAPAQEYASAHSSAPEPTHLRQSQHVLDDASHYLADFAVSVPPRALVPAFEMVETYRKITAETGSDTRATLPSTTEYTLQTANPALNDGIHTPDGANHLCTESVDCLYPHAQPHPGANLRAGAGSY